MTQPNRQQLAHLVYDHGLTVRDVARMFGIQEKFLSASFLKMPLEENDRKRPPSRSASHEAAQTKPRVLANWNIRRDQRRVSAPNTLVIAGNEIIDALLAGIFFV